MAIQTMQRNQQYCRPTSTVADCGSSRIEGSGGGPPPGLRPPDPRELLLALREQQSLHEDRIEELLQVLGERLEGSVSRAVDRLEKWGPLGGAALPLDDAIFSQRFYSSGAGGNSVGSYGASGSRPASCAHSKNSRSGLLANPSQNHRFANGVSVGAESCPGMMPDEVDELPMDEAGMARGYSSRGTTVQWKSTDAGVSIRGEASTLRARAKDDKWAHSASTQMHRATGKSETFGRSHSEQGNATGDRVSVQLQQLHRQRRQLMKQDTIRISHCGGSVKACASSISGSRQFESVVAALIVCSAVITGVQEDWQVKNLNATPPAEFLIFQLCFNVCFTIELVLRFLAEGAMFFISRQNKNLNWNIFDSVLVLLALCDEIVSRVTSSAPDVRAVRLLRVMRLVRVVRIIRVLRFFRELRVMVSGIMSSSKPLFWAVVLLLIIMFIFAVCILPFVGEEMASAASCVQSDTKSCEDGTMLVSSFGSLLTAVWTLFKAISGGVDWGDVAAPLMDISPFLGGAFAVYIAFASFCVLNIITGVFVENASRSSSRDDDMMMAEEIDTKLHWWADIQDLFEEADVNENGALELVEFVTWAQDLRIQARFRKLGMDVDSQNAHAIFNLLDIDSSGSIDLEKFALGVQQFHGHARSLDIARVRLDNKKLQKQVQALGEFLGIGEHVDFVPSFLGRPSRLPPMASRTSSEPPALASRTSSECSAPPPPGNVRPPPPPLLADEQTSDCDARHA